MKAKTIFKVGAFLISGALLFSMSSCSKKEGCTDSTATNYDAEAEKDDGSCEYTVTQAYIGSDQCKSCHTEYYNDWKNSGHPYKLTKVVNGAAPKYPYTTIPKPPDPYQWSDITYVIGGYNWKARFLDKNGYIITGDKVQYNMANGSWGAYEKDVTVGTKKYTCGRCHTTGWVSVADGGTPQDGLAGMDGEFTEGGIGCEACHGKGAVHASSQKEKDIVVDKTAELCGKCHYRDANHKILAKGNYIQHHEQYDEMLSGKHKTLTCVTCHDPHKTVNHGQTGGITKTCESCHSTKTASKHTGQTLTCKECHLPSAGKSALATNKYTADVQTHIFKINTSETGNMFETIGTNQYAKDNYGVTVDFVCYKCHKDKDGVGGTASAKTMAELSAKATGFHN